jgi:hypothetical protein
MAGPHDYGDCMTMAYVMAAIGGIGTGNNVEKPKSTSRVVIRRPSMGGMKR